MSTESPPAAIPDATSRSAGGIRLLPALGCQKTKNQAKQHRPRLRLRAELAKPLMEKDAAVFVESDRELQRIDRIQVDAAVRVLDLQEVADPIHPRRATARCPVARRPASRRGRPCHRSRAPLDASD